MKPTVYSLHQKRSRKWRRNGCPKFWGRLLEAPRVWREVETARGVRILAQSCAHGIATCSWPVKVCRVAECYKLTPYYVLSSGSGRPRLEADPQRVQRWADPGLRLCKFNVRLGKFWIWFELSELPHPGARIQVGLSSRVHRLQHCSGEKLGNNNICSFLYHLLSTHRMDIWVSDSCALQGAVYNLIIRPFIDRRSPPSL